LAMVDDDEEDSVADARVAADLPVVLLAIGLPFGWCGCREWGSARVGITPSECSRSTLNQVQVLLISRSVAALPRRCLGRRSLE
jgi:hypothetical protein